MADEQSQWEMVPIDGSTLIAEVGFNAETHQGRVTFAKNGSVYEYDGCTREEFDAIAQGASAGETFIALWRTAKPYRKVLG